MVHPHGNLTQRDRCCFRSGRVIFHFVVVYVFLHATCAAMHWRYSGTMRCNLQLYFCFIFFNVQMHIHKLRGSDSIAIVLICNFRLQCGRGAAGPGAVQVRRRLWFVGRNVFV